MLKRALLANAVFSGCSALIFALLSGPLSTHIPLPWEFWMLLALGLAAFTAALAFLATDSGLAQRYTSLVVAADMGWIMLTIAGLVLFFRYISPFGIMVIVAVNLLVGILARWQYRSHQGPNAGLLT